MFIFLRILEVSQKANFNDSMRRLEAQKFGDLARLDILYSLMKHL